MSTVYLNGEFLPMQEARISPMDRGFLFGDGIYEVIPSYGGRTVGLSGHLSRLASGLAAIGIVLPTLDWSALIEELLQRNNASNTGIYLHVSRGTDVRRFHAYPDPNAVPPTVFAFTFDIPPEPQADIERTKRYRVTLAEDKRWRRCQIKSTSLLGNVMHFQQGVEAGVDETILYNADHQVTEASACNVFMVKEEVVFTAPLDDQILPGITRQILIEILRSKSDLKVVEQSFSIEDLLQADEVWLTSSTKEVAPVIEVAGQAIGQGGVGPIWLRAQTLFKKHKYDY
jgi:D-alanine transaminase